MATIAVFLVLGGGAYAATGGNFILGQSNSASSRTSLSAPISGKTLRVTNTSTGTGATALGLNVASGHPPFTVNSDTQVANLNADQLDGKNSSAFQAKGDSVPIQASLDIGKSSFWDIGPDIQVDRGRHVLERDQSLHPGPAQQRAGNRLLGGWRSDWQ